MTCEAFGVKDEQVVQVLSEHFAQAIYLRERKIRKCKVQIVVEAD